MPSADTFNEGLRVSSTLLDTPNTVNDVAIERDKTDLDHQKLRGSLVFPGLMVLLGVITSIVTPLLDGVHDSGPLDTTILVGGLIVGVLALVLGSGKLR